MIARPIPRPGPIPFGNAGLANALSTGGRHVASGQAFMRGKLGTQWHPQGGVGMSMSAGGTDKPGQPGHTHGHTHGHTIGQNSGQNSPPKGARHDGTDDPRHRELRATFHGHGVLSVRSSVTGKLYRFQGHADTIVIDPRDALLLGRLSDLQVR